MTDDSPRRAFAFEAMLELEPDVDTRAPGAAVTVALCGSWEHDGPCRWPHNSRIDASSAPARLRTVVVADDQTDAEVVARIESALGGDPRWSVASATRGDIGPGEQALANRLMNPKPPNARDE